ncbi:MAG: hypothetical protein EOR81_32300 [Mesorhizobium sp.]|nr:MAG: hypothetical protein EOR81_32300 [Mesorhizobium sp.]
MSAVRHIIGQALYDYEYEFERNKKTIKTRTVFKPEGIKSETMTNALKTGQLNGITLLRPAKPDFVDADGLFQPINEVMRIRITGEINSNNWSGILSNLVNKARKQGWEEFNVDIGLDDDRKRTVKIEKDQEAKEILFIRSEQASFKSELQNCSVEIVEEVVNKALSTLHID